MEEPVKNEKKAVRISQKFEKGQIVSSARYASRKDLLEAVLNDGEHYDFETVDKLIEKYMKGQVK